MALPVFEKCEFLRREIQKQNPNINVSINEVGMGFAGSEGCLIDFEDQKLKEQLRDAGKEWGAWSTQGSLLIDKNGKIPESDMPINQQSCERNGKRGYTIVNLPVEDVLPRACEIYQIHIHDGGRPSTHLRVKCKDSSLNTLRELATFIRITQGAGMGMCKQMNIEAFAVKK